MWHPGFQNWQTGNRGQFLPGGKLVLFVHSKRVIFRFIHGRIFVQWINLGRIALPKILTFRKSFETGSYSNTKNRPANNYPRQSNLTIYPLDKLSAPEGFFEKISQWVNPKIQQQINHSLFSST
ncbi:MAG: hypothetical protein COA78_03930 [Blastopirellula sp.]|nr:MAG: hypothetical protein COA78_03930 [Blastopirellula sp.]